MPERSAEQIQREIEQSRVALAGAIDQLAYRGNSKRIAENAKQTVRAKMQSPQGQAALAVVGAVVLVLVVRRVRKH